MTAIWLPPDGDGERDYGKSLEREEWDYDPQPVRWEPLSDRPCPFHLMPASEVAGAPPYVDFVMVLETPRGEVSRWKHGKLIP